MKKGKYRTLFLFGLISCGLVMWTSFKEKNRHKANLHSLLFSEKDASAESGPQKYCERQRFGNKSYIVCRATPARDHIRLFLNDAEGKPYKYFRNIQKELATRGETLAFAMNAGMYHADYSAVGLYVENGRQYHPVSTRDGAGNFHMKPNGVFYLSGGKAGVLETQTYLNAGIKPDFATQSGPMLVINNSLHKRFIPDSPYLEYRNAVGVTRKGEVVFAISEERVNFDELAHFFRDALKTPNALFLDGSISSLYALEMHRADWFHALGPIIGVVISKKDKTL